MTSTPRLDALTASGTNHVFDRIRLADGHALAFMTCPGADKADEVALFPGLTAPDTQAWVYQDSWEGWLTGGDLGDGPLYLDVPIEAVRDLIVQHGGEHEDQENQQAAPGTGGESGQEADQDPLFPGLLGDIADLHGRFKDGYSADDIRTVFGRIHDEDGPYLVCVWEYADQCGFGGDSQFYAEEWDGGLVEVQPDIRRWLSGQQETPGPVGTWLCAPVAEPTEFPATDDLHNYARADRTKVPAMDDDAATIHQSAPLIAAAVAQLGTAAGLAFAYLASGVVVTGRRLDDAFDPLYTSFTTAGWRAALQHSEDFRTLESVRFRPPWTLTIIGRPVMSPPDPEPHRRGDEQDPATADQADDSNPAASAY